jgi:cytosine/adenosine deaminase-related metal-dependent hydrolase
MLPTPWTITARWAFPVDSPPLPHGTVTILGDRIVGVEPQGVRRPDREFGHAALLPGLVNAHTHLDLSGCRQPLPADGDFPSWVRRIVQYRRSLTPGQELADARAGVAESLRHGVTLVGDIAAGGRTWPVLAAAPLRAVVFHELLGLPRERAGKAWSEALAWLRSCPATATCRPGLSTHAPYSVRTSLFRAAAALAAARRLPLTVHLAETLAERELLATHAGPFVSFLQSVGVWDPAGLVADIQQVLNLHRDTPQTLFAHGNFLTEADSVPAGATVVYCPRTHAHFGHPPHPWHRLLSRGVRVALGTDSRASNPDLDVLAEARWLHAREPEVPGELLVRMATLSGAEALGWADDVGSLTAGKSADFVVVPLPAGDEDPHRLLLGSSNGPSAVFIRGAEVPF